MIYSVWSPGDRLYKYFQTSEPQSDDGPTPKVRSSKAAIGYSPSEISWKLPGRAISVGSGPHAKGIVVHPSSNNDFISIMPTLGGLGDFETGSIIKVGLLLAATYGLWKVFGDKK